MPGASPNDTWQQSLNWPRYTRTGSFRRTYAHPVLSIWDGTDIIYYGSDLADYIDHEFNEDHEPDWENWNPKATVPFWKDFLR
ncbi:hypothetical protein OG788_41825 [Streptomyces sp. NBC_00647]|uniref:hypothetical protein n=1 Tax=Streptomyces sp. NBC_00647 TaxID=2975796 RepID=UPI003248EC57